MSINACSGSGIFRPMIDALSKVLISRQKRFSAMVRKLSSNLIAMTRLLDLGGRHGRWLGGRRLRGLRALYLQGEVEELLQCLDIGLDDSGALLLALGM